MIKIRTDNYIKDLELFFREVDTTVKTKFNSRIVCQKGCSMCFDFSHG